MLEGGLGSFHGDEGGFQEGALGIQAALELGDLLVEAFVLAGDAVGLDLEGAGGRAGVVDEAVHHRIQAVDKSLGVRREIINQIVCIGGQSGVEQSGIGDRDRVFDSREVDTEI